MNTYRYMIDDGKCHPVTPNWEDGVPVAHTAMIEMLAECHSKGKTFFCNVVTRKGKKLDFSGDLKDAIHHKLSGRLSAVCFFHEEQNDHFGPIGYYHIIE